MNCSICARLSTRAGSRSAIGMEILSSPGQHRWSARSGRASWFSCPDSVCDDARALKAGHIAVLRLRAQALPLPAEEEDRSDTGFAAHHGERRLPSGTLKHKLSSTV